MNKLKVLIVDDSALIRQLLTEILGSDPGIEVVGAAADPYIARDKIKELNPDVLTLDVEMPRMDGISFLRNLMRLRPMPVVMISTLTQQGADTTLEALSLGAIDFVAKPKVDVVEKLSDYSQEIIEKVKVAGKAKVRPLVERAAAKVSAVEQKLSADDVMGKAAWTGKIKTTEKIIAIGASTGGTEVISRIVTNLPETVPGIAIAQHMPEKFTYAFATRLNSISDLVVKEAENGDRLYHGVVLIAPGNRQMEIRRDVHGFFVEVNDKPAVNNHKPSVDVLMQSVAEHSDKNTTGIILTGMGNDGAKGLLDMKKAGAITIAQDKESSAIFGMPAEAVRVGGADYVKNIEQIIDYIKNIT